MNWLERTSFFIPRRAIRMMRLGLYRSVTSLTGHPAVQVPQEKHFLIFSPPGSRAMRTLKLGSRFLESIMTYPVRKDGALAPTLSRINIICFFHSTHHKIARLSNGVNKISI